MVMDSLTQLIEEDSLVIQARPANQAELIEHLMRVDLSFEGATGWVAEGDVGNVTLRPNYVGDRKLKIIPNRYTERLRFIEKIKGSRTSEAAEVAKMRRHFLETHGFSVDELFRVEENHVVHTDKGTEVNYDVLVDEQKRYSLTVQTFYKPIEM